MSGRPDFGGLDVERLGALVFELASQLHIERTRRLALEAALADAGLVAAPAIERAGDGPAFREHAAQAADRSIRRLLAILSESTDERAPLRGEDDQAAGET